MRVIKRGPAGNMAKIGDQHIWFGNSTNPLKFRFIPGIKIDEKLKRAAYWYEARRCS